MLNSLGGPQQPWVFFLSLSLSLARSLQANQEQLPILHHSEWRVKLHLGKVCHMTQQNPRQFNMQLNNLKWKYQAVIEC